jgi:uncharacterized damage-inducible protein DinB
MRTDPDKTGPELDRLVQFLDFHRETMLIKADGLTREQLNQPISSSSLTIGGLLNHLALVEDWWFGVRFAGEPEREPWAGVDWDADPDWEFRTAAELDPDQLRQRYRDACVRSRQIVADAADLDQLSALAGADDARWDLRWILLHMLEETARHVGHADLLRESIDGVVGE